MTISGTCRLSIVLLFPVAFSLKSLAARVRKERT